MKNRVFSLFILIIALNACKKDPAIPGPDIPSDSLYIYNPTPYNITYPSWFGAPPLPNPDNPLTNEGVALGRKLFYDPILSGDSSQSCSSCHKQQFAFSDGLAVSTGIDGIAGTRNAMALINLAYVQNFFWDGRSPNLTAQALEPVPNPIEMHLSWSEAIDRLKNHSGYPQDFYAAFGTLDIDSIHVAKALSQFMRTLISSNAKIDQVMQTIPYNVLLLSPLELQGKEIYENEVADCFHCHGLPRMTDNEFRNNGLDASFTDLGRALVTGNPLDNGKFRAPTLRNIALTAPYMHDGRFSTLRQVIEHYSFGLHPSSTIDPLMKKINQGGLLLEDDQVDALLAFLNTFTDTSFTTNPAFSNPFE